MSLLQLLTTGKSLVGLNDSEPRYRLTHERFLPQFGPAKNQFCTGDNLDRNGPEVRRRTEWAPASIQQPAANLAPLPARNPSELPSLAAAKAPTLVVSADRHNPTKGVLSQTAALRSQWAGKLRALFTRPASKPARMTFAAPTKPHVQGELALEKIKVVRNDLSDADLEVVPAKLPMARTNVAPAAHAVEKTVFGGVTRGRLVGLFRADKA
jgi:hypothetical protein